MYDPGYTDYKDGRLQPPEGREAEPETCGGCIYYRDVTHVHVANGMTHCVGACVFEVYHAGSWDELSAAELPEAIPNDDACEDYREEK